MNTEMRGYWITIESEEPEKYDLILRGFRGEKDILAVYNKEYKSLVDKELGKRLDLKGVIPAIIATQITLNQLFLSGLPTIEVNTNGECQEDDPYTLLVDISAYIKDGFETLNNDDIMVIQ